MLPNTFESHKITVYSSEEKIAEITTEVIGIMKSLLPQLVCDYIEFGGKLYETNGDNSITNDNWSIIRKNPIFFGSVVDQIPKLNIDYSKFNNCEEALYKALGIYIIEDNFSKAKNWQNPEIKIYYPAQKNNILHINEQFSGFSSEINDELHQEYFLSKILSQKSASINKVIILDSAHSEKLDQQFFNLTSNKLRKQYPTITLERIFVGHLLEMSENEITENIIDDKVLILSHLKYRHFLRPHFLGLFDLAATVGQAHAYQTFLLPHSYKSASANQISTFLSLLLLFWKFADKNATDILPKITTILNDSIEQYLSTKHKGKPINSVTTLANLLSKTTETQQKLLLGSNSNFVALLQNQETRSKNSYENVKSMPAKEPEEITTINSNLDKAAIEMQNFIEEYQKDPGYSVNDSLFKNIPTDQDYLKNIKRIAKKVVGLDVYIFYPDTAAALTKLLLSHDLGDLKDQIKISNIATDGIKAFPRKHSESIIGSIWQCRFSFTGEIVTQEMLVGLVDNLFSSDFEILKIELLFEINKNKLYSQIQWEE